jgi:regulator of sirC expression with transglutaminase-like and TPR domain
MVDGLGYGGSVDPTAGFAELVERPEAEVPLDRAALLIAAHAQPDLDVAAEVAALDELAAGCPAPTFEAWRRYLFDDLGFTGNVERYFDPANSFLNEVRRRRLGLPITLSVLGMEVGRRIGVPIAGVGMPGHFLLRAGERWVDPFLGGRVLDRAACEARFRTVNGNDTPFRSSYLEPTGTRSILARMLLNLRGVYASLGDLEALTWVYELRLAIPGTSPLERRDLARVLGSTGQFADAAESLEELAESVPDAAESLRAEAQALRARLN